MKFKLSLILLFTICICSAQMQPISITLNNGETINGIGKKKNHTFKYKLNENAKPQEIEFSKIKSVDMEVSTSEKIIYKF